MEEFFDIEYFRADHFDSSRGYCKIDYKHTWKE